METTTLENIKQQFTQVIKYSQESYCVSSKAIDLLFDQWYDAKKWFIDLFGGGLIYEVPQKITFELDQSAKTKKFDDFIDKVWNYFCNERLALFLQDQKEGFFTNTTISDFKMSDGTVIPKGMKMLKAFKFFESNSAILDKLQTIASMIIQENKIEGTLCFSVHPLDYISLSNNAHNWRSCHALDGEYRGGNLSYMLDKSTIVCYLRSDNPYVNITSFPSDVLWNSKKWRMLLFFSDNKDALFAGRQYPFVCDGALNVVLENLRPYLEKIYRHSDFFSWLDANWSPWHKDYMTSFKYEDGSWESLYEGGYRCIGGKLYMTDDLIKEGKHSLMFNDLTRSSCYTPYYCWANYVQHPIQFSIGKEVPCLICGDHYVEDTESMICHFCYQDNSYNDDDSPIIYCECCGQGFRLYDDCISFFDELGGYVCDHCLDHECTYCPDCEQYFYNSETVLDYETGESLCVSCSERRKHNDEGNTSQGTDRPEAPRSLWKRFYR